MLPSSPLLNHAGGRVNGRWITSAAGTFSVENPASGELLARFPSLGREETAQAIDAAARLPLPLADLETRRTWLRAIHALLIEHRSELARLITLEQGKPLREAEVEVEYSAAFFDYYAGHLPKLLAPRREPTPLKGHDWSVHLHPAGVAALITPWNFPLGMLAKKLAAALAAGCPVIVKPAEATPLSTLALWHLLESLPIPPAALQLLIGAPEPIGATLCHDPRVRVISFTGSTATGRWLARESAPTLKHLSLELGGNAPCLIFADADLPTAVDALVANKFRCAGQTCVCTNRVYVEAAAHERLIALLLPRIHALKVGPGLDPSSDIGPLIHPQAVASLAARVADAIAAGAVPHTTPLPDNLPPERFFAPTLLTGCQPNLPLLQEEIFGPVLPILTFPNGDETAALAAAHDTPYGLAAYAFTGCRDRAQRLGEQLRFGHVAVNSAISPTPELPFGGFRQSGIGREGGPEGLLEFCEIQTIARSS